jgi:hypothetical protein
MNYSSELSVYKKVGFVSTKKEIGKESKSEVLEKFSKFLKEQKPAPAVRYHVKNGVPYKVVNGKLVPLIKVVKA